MLLRLGFMLVVLFLSSACVQNHDLTSQFSGISAYQHVLQQMEYGPRTPDSHSKQLTAAYIKGISEQSGFVVEYQNFTYWNRLLQANAAGTNIIAKSFSERNSTLIILGAHYDCRPFADRDTPDRRNEPVPGANDGASGVAVLLEAARVLGRAALNGTLVLVFFDAEDSGDALGGWIQGSRYFVSQLAPAEKEKVRWAVVLDMIGDSDLQIYREVGSNGQLTDAIWRKAGDLGYPQFIDQLRYQILDDHLPFVEAGIPAADVIDFDYAYWHTAADTADKVSPQSLEAVGRTTVGFILEDSGLPIAPVGFAYTDLLAMAGGVVALALLSYVVVKRVRRPRPWTGPSSNSQLRLSD